MYISKDENDFYVSIEKALDEIDPNWRDYNGIIIGGSHAPSNIEEKLNRIKEARENKIPFLGICMGMELMVIEFARNVLNLENANSQEIDPKTETPIIHKMKDLRVGNLPAYYWGQLHHESFWHNYKFNKNYAALFKEWQIDFTGNIACMMSLFGQTFFGVQFHPEYQSSQKQPHPILKQFIEVCRQKT